MSSIYYYQESPRALFAACLISLFPSLSCKMLGQLMSRRLLKMIKYCMKQASFWMGDWYKAR